MSGNSKGHYVTTSEIVMLTGLGKSTVTRVLREGRVPSIRGPHGDGRSQYLVRDEDLLAAIKNGVFPQARPGLQKPRGVIAEAPAVRVEKASERMAESPVAVAALTVEPRFEVMRVRVALGVSALALALSVASLIAALAL